MNKKIGLVIVLVALLVPATSGVDGHNSVVNQKVWTDLSGDVEGNPPALLNFLDILEVRAGASESDIQIEFELVSLSADWLQISQAEYWVEVKYQGELFHFVARYLGNQTSGLNLIYPDGDTEGSIWRASGTNWERIGRMPATSSLAASTIQMVIPLSEIFVSTYPQPGETVQITGIQSFFQTGEGGWHPFGEPDDLGLFYQDFVEISSADGLTVPGQTSTLATLNTPQPTRYSNGEATTYHWPISIINLDAKTRDFKIMIATDPEVVLRAPATIVVPANSSRIFDLYATVPFWHGHGEDREVNVEAASPGVKIKLPLTIHYLDVPQPAGHHDTLYLHGGSVSSSGATSQKWMNTEIPSVTPPIRGRSGECRYGLDDVRGGHAWTFPLRPGLLIGVDGKEGGKLTLDATVSVNAPIPAGKIYADLTIYDVNQLRGLPGFSIADRPSINLELALAPTDVPIHLEWELPEDLDYRPWQPDTNLRLEILYCPGDAVPEGEFLTALYGDVSPIPPLTMVGGKLILPFSEYRDTLQFVGGNESVWSVEKQSLMIPPGGTVFWELSAQLKSVNPAIFGLSESYARIQKIESRAGLSQVVVSLAAPAELAEGDLLEFVVISDAADITGDAIRLTAIVSNNAADMSGELASLLSGRQNSPIISPVFMLGCFALVGLGLRKIGR